MSESNKLTPGDFEFVSQLIQEKSAIMLRAGKEYLVESRLAPLKRALELPSIAALVHELRKKSNPRLMTEVIEAMTTNETLFFRDRHPFEALQEDLLPKLIEKNAEKKTLTFWCAASSSGQEPYSVCILLREHFPQLADWRINFITTDISQLMVERTKTGTYSQLEVNRGMPAPLMVKYFTKEGPTWQIKESLRSMLDPRTMNLAGPWGAMPQFDIVFIRNVLIYFDTETKREILGKIRRLLVPGGTLFLGGTETTINVDDSFDRVRSASSWVYRPAA